MAAYKGRLTPRPDGPAWANVQIDQGNAEEVIAARRQWSRQQVEARQARAVEKAAAKEAKRLAKLAELGGVPKEDVVAPSIDSRPLEPLTDKQQQTLLEVHQRLGLEAPDLVTHEGRAAAWAVIKAEKAMRQGHGNPQAEAPRKAESRDWASMPLEQFLAISGVKVRKNPKINHRAIDFDVHLPGGVKVTVVARDEDGAKAAAHKKLMRDAQKLGAATGVPDKTSPISPVLPIVTPAIPVESPRAGMAAAAAAQQRIASMSDAELQKAVARTRAKYGPEPPPAPSQPDVRKVALPSSPVFPPTESDAPTADGPPLEDDWTPRRPRGRGR